MCVWWFSLTFSLSSTSSSVGWSIFLLRNQSFLSVLYSSFIFLFWMLIYGYGGFPGGSLVKNPPAKSRDAGLIFGLGRSPEKEMATHSSILALEIPQTENLAGYSPWGCERVGHDSETKQQQHGYEYNSWSWRWASWKKLSKATEPNSYPTDVHGPPRQAYARYLLMYWFCGIPTRQRKLTPIYRWGHFPREANDLPEVTQLLSSRVRT